MSATKHDNAACSACGHKFAKGEGRFAINGFTCIKCYENRDITVNIGGHEISHKLLNEYAEAVEAVRRGAIIADSRTDPVMLMQREQNRIAAHRRIFETAGIEYGNHHWEDNAFQTELAKWLDVNTISYTQEAGS